MSVSFAEHWKLVAESSEFHRTLKRAHHFSNSKYAKKAGKRDGASEFTPESGTVDTYANLLSTTYLNISKTKRRWDTVHRPYMFHPLQSSSSVAVSVAGVGDHDLPLFAISCIHKHLRSASSQPSCYTVLYFYSLTTSASFSFDFPLLLIKYN